MPSMTFRFTTECEMTLDGDSYQEMYLQFKDFLHGVTEVQGQTEVFVCPPESDQMFFRLDDAKEMTEIPYFKGSFEADIAQRAGDNPLKATMPAKMPLLPSQVTNHIPDVYW
ncbi:MAG: hypothetical protein ACRBBW_08140 [Cellvibrionaceae bacterium]